MADKPPAVAEYFAALPDSVRPTLEEVRVAILRGLPGAEERVRYGMPAVMLDDRYALHYAAWKKHTGLYPVTQLPDPLESEIAPYRSHKDSLRFVHTEPVPLDLIERLAAHLGGMHGVG